MIDPAIRNALLERSDRGNDVGADAVWARATTVLDTSERAPEDAIVLPLEPTEQAEPRSTRSHFLWLAAVASLLCIIAGGVLTASGVRNQSHTDTTSAADAPGSSTGDAPVLHFEGVPAEPWQPLLLDPETFVSQSQLGANDFIIILSPGRAADIAAIGDLAPPSLACDRDMTNDGGFPDSCLSRPRTIQSDRTTSVPGIDEDIRLVERTGEFTQTTATLLWNDEDVVRVAGTCSAGCVKQALALLREDDGTSVRADTSPFAGRILVGIVILTLGFLNLLVVRRLRNDPPQNPGGGTFGAARPRGDW